MTASITTNLRIDIEYIEYIDIEFRMNINHTERGS